MAGAGRLDQRYTDVFCFYRIGESGDYARLAGTVVSAGNKNMEMRFIIPPLNFIEIDTVDYYFQMPFDGHKNTRHGGNLQLIKWVLFKATVEKIVQKFS